MLELSSHHYESYDIPPLKERSLYDELALEAQKWEGFPSIKHDSERPDLSMDPIGGFSCSGFVTFVFKQTGISFPDGIDRFYCNTALDYYGIPVQLGLQKPGDLIFFSYDGEAPNHMGVVISPTKYIHAPGEKGTGVEIKDILQQEIYLGGREPVHYHTNPIGIKRPMDREGRWAVPIERQVFPNYNKTYGRE